MAGGWVIGCLRRFGPHRPSAAPPSPAGPSRRRRSRRRSRSSIRSSSARSAASWSCTAARWASRSVILRCSSRLGRSRSSARRASASRSAACCGQAGGAGQYSRRADIHVHQFDPVVGEHELPHLIRMGRAARLQHEQQPVASRRRSRHCAAAARCPPSTTRSSCSSRRRGPASWPAAVIPRALSRSIWRATIEVVSGPAARAGEAGDPVEHRHRRRHSSISWPERQVGLQPERRRPRRPDAQQAARPTASRSIPIDRMLRRICSGDSSKENYSARSPRRQAASTRWRPGWSCRCPPSRTPGRCAPRNTPPPSMSSSRRPRSRPARPEAAYSRPDRGDGQHREARPVDQERELVGAVRRAAVLDHPQAPGGDLLRAPDGRAGSRSRRRTPPGRAGSASRRLVRRSRWP